MEQLFAVRVLVHYYDKPKVDHAAVRKLLSAVDTLKLLLTDGTSTPISNYIQTNPHVRAPISDVLGPSDTSLVQVASVFMLAEARAAADAVRSSPADLETACINLERLLACLATTRPVLPVHDINQSARVKLGTAARRRAFNRASTSSSTSDLHHQAPILKAVNAVLRLCDVATHCLAVVARQTIAPRHICQTAVTLSTRLLTLAASLYDVQRRDPNPALSFSSSNSLRTALVSGAMYLGAIAIEHLDIEPMNWVHVANRIVISSTTSVPPRTSIMSALFAGMIKSAKDYEACDRNTMAARRAAMLLSTLHVVLETDMSRDFWDHQRNSDQHSTATAPEIPNPTTSSTIVTILPTDETIDPGCVSQAARSFLGERVVAAEEDGDEARIAARTVYQACEEYAERAGETEGVMGLLARLFASAGRQCRQEPVDEAPVSISESALNIPCHPDESDASSDSPNVRSEGQPFPIDVFDQRSRDGLATSPTAGTAPDVSLEPAERVQLHRQIGALALETLAHWVERTHLIGSYANLDIAKFGAEICSSAGRFSLTESPESYDMRAAMTDFGALIGFTIENRLSELPAEARATKWRDIIIDLISTCQRVNPVLTGILNCCRSPQVMTSLLKVFLSNDKHSDKEDAKDTAVSTGLPVGSVLSMLLGVISRENAFVAVERLVLFLKERGTQGEFSPDVVSHRAACLMLLSHAAFVYMGTDKMADTTRSAMVSLYRSDVESHEAPVYPQKGVQSEVTHFSAQKLQKLPDTSGSLNGLITTLSPILEIFGDICAASSNVFTSTDEERKVDCTDADHEHLLDMPKSRKLLYHFLWALLMVERVVETLEHNSRTRFRRGKSALPGSACFPSSAPFFCLEAASDKSIRNHALNLLKTRRRPSAQLLYVSECLSLLSMREETKGSHDIGELLQSTLGNAADITSGLSMREVAHNYSSLLKAFQTDPKEAYSSSASDYLKSRGMFLPRGGSKSSLACIQLAMVYIRTVGGDHLHDLLADALRTSSKLIDMVSRKRLVEVKDAVFALLANLVFIPSSMSTLRSALVEVSEKVITCCFPHISAPSVIKEIIYFISQVCGLVSLVQIDSKSAVGIQSLCKFASETADQSDSETSVLRFSFGCGEVPQHFGKDIVNWLKESLPRVELSPTLAALLIPVDESAVAVSSHAQSLSLLTTSCENSDCWRTCTLTGIQRLFQSSCVDFATQMVRRSVVQSATMNEGVLAFFERLVGASSSPEAGQVLRRCFNAACELFETEVDVTLEGKVRLMTFAVRMSMCYGRISVQNEHGLTPTILEPKLFGILLSSLEMKIASSTSSFSNSDEQLALFLCSLLDAFLSGLDELYSSRFSISGSSGLAEAPAVTSGEIGNESDESSTLEQDRQPFQQEEHVPPTLCTYTSTGNQYVEQHWYYCYSCALDGSEGVCSVCARVCHKGCELSYSKFSRFFCDCGAGSDPRLETGTNTVSTEEIHSSNGVQQTVAHKPRPTRSKQPKPCLCTKAVKRSEIKPIVKTKPSGSRRPQTSHGTKQQDSLICPSFRRQLITELSSLRARSSSDESRNRYNMINKALTDASKTNAFAENLLQTALRLLRDNSNMRTLTQLTNLTSKRIENPNGENESSEPHKGNSTKTMKKIRSMKLLKSASSGAAGGLTCVAKVPGPSSLLSFSGYNRHLAVGTRSGDIELSDMNSLLTKSEHNFEKPLPSIVGKLSLPFSPRIISFHPDSPNVLLFVGDDDVVVGTKSTTEQLELKWTFSTIHVKQAQIELFGEAAALVDSFWVNCSMSLVAVITERRVLVFDASVLGEVSLPVFFAQVPHSELGGPLRNDPKIISASVWNDLSQPSNVDNFFLLLLTSDGCLRAAHTPLNGGCVDLNQVSYLPAEYRQNQSTNFNDMTFIRTSSLILITLREGGILAAEVLLRIADSKLEFSIPRFTLYRDVTSKGPGTKLDWIPGTSSFISYQINQGLSSCAVLTLRSNGEIDVQQITGNISVSVVAATAYPETAFLGETLPCGVLILFEDGSVHKVGVTGCSNRGKLSEQSSISSVVERQRLRALRFCQAQREAQAGYNPLPETIGFFEKCRLVSEPLTVEGSSLESGITHDRMAVTIAGEGGDCVVSQVVNESFSFTVGINNQSLVLVGARIRVGGTDRSRNRVPAEVKVFDRPVEWHGRNGLKRWIDIPFSFPESASSPQRVKLELVPHRSSERGRSGPDGLVAIDCLELHAISTVEFAERSQAFERERASHMDSLKKQKELSQRRRRNRYPNINTSKSLTTSTKAEQQKFTQEQASALTAIHAVDKDVFVTRHSAGELLYEANFLWVGSVDGTGVWDPLFLSCLQQVCLGVDQNFLQPESHEVYPRAAARVIALYENATEIVRTSVSNLLELGIEPDIDGVEKGLYTLGGMARVLLNFGRKVDVDIESWLQTCTKHSPQRELMQDLLKVHMHIGRSGRLGYRSLEHAATSATDISFLLCLLTKLRDPPAVDNSTDPFDALTCMLTDLDQTLRLLTCQRLIELFDSFDGSSDYISSPFEGCMTAVLLEPFDFTDTVESPDVTDPEIIEEDPDENQRWAYRCDSCGKVCDREWWHCMDCDDFDLCTDCLRDGKQCPGSSHNEAHVLLRGSIDDEMVDPVSTECPPVLTRMGATLQSVLSPLMDSVLKTLTTESNTSWRFLDVIELVSQLVGPKCTPEFREQRVEALFNSSLSKVSHEVISKLGRFMDASEYKRQTQSFVHTCECICALFNIYLSGRGSSMPVHLHSQGIPCSIVRLLQCMRGFLAEICESICLDRNDGTQTNDLGLLSASIWNENVRGLVYDILSERDNPKKSKRRSGVFQMTGALPLNEVAALHVWADSLRVLDYSYRSVWSPKNVIDMQNFPQALLCDVINMCETASVRMDDCSLFLNISTAARSLLSTVSFDSDEALNNILDMYLYEGQSKKLQAVLDSLSTHDSNIRYELAVEVADIIDNIHKAALAHPSNWREFVVRNPNVIEVLLRFAKYFENSVQVQLLQLVGSGLSVSDHFTSRVLRGQSFLEHEFTGSTGRVKLDDDVGVRAEILNDSTLSKKAVTCAELIPFCQDEPQVSKDILAKNNFSFLNFLVKNVMLKSQTKKARRAASQTFVFIIARGAADVTAEDIVNAINGSLLSGLEWMQFAGNLADGLMVCLRTFITCAHQKLFGPSSDSRLVSFTAKITSSLKDRCRLMVSHPNARLYARLSEMIDLPGYFLESEPCISCASASWESSEFRENRFDTIRAETKYTDCSIMYRFVTVYEIQSVSVKIVDPRRTRRVKKINILYSVKSIADGADLKSSEHPWKVLKSINLSPNATEGSISLKIPVVAANVKLHFTEFHSVDSDNSTMNLDSNTVSTSMAGSRQVNNSRSGDTLQCPRCSRTVTDRHGICRNCHENAYQCRQCRNINYENLDGFLCNECGYCKHGRFEFSALGRPTHYVETIKNEEDRKAASKMIERETSSIHRCMEQLVKLRSSIIKSLTLGIPNDDYREKTKLLSTARVGLADLLDSVTPRSEIAVLEALLEGQVSHEMDDTTPTQHGGVNLSDEALGDGQLNNENNDRDQSLRSGSSITSPISRGGRADPLAKSHHSDSTNINRRTISLTASYTKECRTVFATLSRGVRILTMTRAELVRHANSVGGDRLRYADEFSEQDDDVETTMEVSAPEPDHILEKLRALRPGTVCYGCTQAFIAKCVQLIQSISKQDGPAFPVVRESHMARDMLTVSSLCEKRGVRDNIRDLITFLVNDNLHATRIICKELERKIGFCIDSYDSVDSHYIARFEMSILESTALLDDSCWEDRLRLIIRILFQASTDALTCSTVAESIILPCLRIALRLLRIDSELTVIESTSETGNNALDAVISEGLPEPSEADQEEGHAAGDTMSLTHSDAVSQELVRSRVSDSVTTGALSELQDIGLGNLGGGQGLIGFRDPTRVDDRRSNQRVGSDLMTGSRAPSSIGTAFDGHMSDEDMEVSSDRTEQLINMNAINSIMESDHDSKRVSANVGLWLDGKQNQSSWIAEIVDRSKTVEDREKLPTFPDIGALSLQKNIFQRWKRITAASNNSALPDEERLVPDQTLHNLSIKKGNWIIRLMLFTPCVAVRKEACSLLEHLCCQEEALQLQLLDLLTGPSLSLGADAGDMSKEFFDLLESTLNTKSHRLYLIGRGFLPRLASIIRTRAERLIQCEVEVESSIRLVNFTEGYSLKRLVALLRLTLEAAPLKRVTVRQKILEGTSEKVVWSLQRAYTCVKKLISLRTRLTDECASQLSEILLSKDFLFSGPTVDSIVTACVSELQTANHRNDAQAVAILLEELCLMLCPERSEPTCLLSLTKAPTQEEFIRGTMSRNPYSSSSFEGPLMRHVKNKICKDLDLPGLLQDDFTMELLVAGNVVKLDLPIMGVYEHIWRGSAAASMAAAIPPPHMSRTFGLRRSNHSTGARGTGGPRGEGLRGTILSFRRVNSERDNTDNMNRQEVRSDPPMVVVYRLSGLDGEATEPIIDSLPLQSNDDQDAEDLYRDTIVFGEVGGFDILFQLLAVVGSWGDDAETAVRAPALRLLRCSCEVAQNRTLLAKSPNAVSTLLDCAASAFEHAQGSPAAVSSAESLLIAAEQILAQQRRELDKKSETMHGTVQVSSDNPAEVMSRVEMFLRQLEVATSPKAEYSILHLLPFLVQGISGAIDTVLKNLLFDWDQIDDEDQQRKAKQLATVLFATPQDLRGNSFVAETIRAEVAGNAVDFIINKFPMPKREFRENWEAAYEQESVPLVLRLFTGLCRFFETDSEASDLMRGIISKSEHVVPVLCQLELAVSGNAIGTSAEELVEAMARDNVLNATIVKERKSIAQGRREAAEASRAAILQETGLSANLETGRQDTTQTDMGNNSSMMNWLEELPEEDGPECVVCGDGFKCRPEEAIAVYVFCRKTPLELGTKVAGQGGTSDNLGGPNAGGGGVGGQVSGNIGGSGSGSSGGRLDWDLWASGRSRGGISGSSRSGSTSCYTTVTHMNAIHLSCHRDAARMDRGSRRDEWDGAALRNSQTKCNNLLPIRPPITLQNDAEEKKKKRAKKSKNNEDDTDEEDEEEDEGTNETSTVRAASASFSSAVEGYFARLSALGRVSLSQSKMVTYDLGRALLRFSDGGTAVFSEHSKGGGSHSNAMVLPHMVQLGLHVIDERGDGKNGIEEAALRTKLGTFLDGDKANDEKDNATGTSETCSQTTSSGSGAGSGDSSGDVTYYLALSMMLHSLEEWTTNMSKFCKRGIQDKRLERVHVLRLITFTDVAQRVMKRGMDVAESEQRFIDALKRHIGCDETFAQEFGDEVNKRWEGDVRSIENNEQMLATLRRSAEIHAVSGAELALERVAAVLEN